MLLPAGGKRFCFLLFGRRFCFYLLVVVDCLRAIVAESVWVAELTSKKCDRAGLWEYSWEENGIEHRPKHLAATVFQAQRSDQKQCSVFQLPLRIACRRLCGSSTKGLWQSLAMTSYSLAFLWQFLKGSPSNRQLYIRQFSSDVLLQSLQQLSATILAILWQSLSLRSGQQSRSLATLWRPSQLLASPHRTVWGSDSALVKEHPAPST